MTKTRAAVTPSGTDQLQLITVVKLRTAKPFAVNMSGLHATFGIADIPVEEAPGPAPFTARN